MAAPGAPAGALMLSFDFELAWGAMEYGHWRARERGGVYRRLRTVLPVLLDALDELEIPATWATVGALTEQPGRQDLDHLPEAARHTAAAVLRQAEPSSLDGRDLIDMIAGRRAGHRFACHSYAHTRFTYPGLDGATVTADLARFRAVQPADWGRVDRLVFPQNLERYYAEVAGSGFQVVRGAENLDFAGGRLAYLASTLTRPPPLANERAVVAGLKRVTGSMFFNTAGRRYRLPLVAWRARRGLAAAVAQGGTLHVWNHPFNFAESEGLLQAFLKLLRRASALRDRGRLAIAML